MKMTSSKEISEKDFLSQIIDLLKLFHWRFEHTFEQRIYARRTSKGFPDIVAVRPPRLLFIELKSEKGKLTPEQEAWLENLRECSRGIFAEGLEVYLWRPSMFDEILEILK